MERHYSGRTDRHSLQAESEIPQNAVWVMNSGTAGTLQKLKNGTAIISGATALKKVRRICCLSSCLLPGVHAGHRRRKSTARVGDFSRGYFIVDHVTGIRTHRTTLLNPDSTRSTRINIWAWCGGFKRHQNSGNESWLVMRRRRLRPPFSALWSTPMKNTVLKSAHLN